MSTFYIIIATCVVLAVTDEHNHIYKDGEEVLLWMSTIGPYNNAQETYNYFSLPFCAGQKLTTARYHETLGEALQGAEREFSGLAVEFKVNIEKTEYCNVKLNNEKFNKFNYAIKNSYRYQMYVDDLPFWAFVGEVADLNYYIWAHKSIQVGYNGRQIVEVSVTPEDKVLVTPKRQLNFTYEVIWKDSNVQFEERFDKYLDHYKVNLVSIFSSFVMIILLVAMVSVILMKTLHKDYVRYNMDLDLGNDYGWRQVHEDVFRPTSCLLLFSALIGVGYQLTIVIFGVIAFTSVRAALYTEHVFLVSVVICMYVITSPLNGYFGGSMYVRMGGKKWIRQMLLSTFLVPAPFFLLAFCINLITLYYKGSRSVPLATMVYITCMCLFVILPLSLGGTLLGRQLAGQPDYPCRVGAVPRSIPEKKWFMERDFIILFGGLLPFISIFVELYLIFTSFWSYKFYHVYGFMLLVFLILVIVSVCVTIVCTYCLLNSEDYQWQWTSFLATASTGIYVFLYSVYYFFCKTNMYGFFQTVFYFGYMALFSGILGIVCGTLGFIGANGFVRKIYSDIKID